MIYLVKLHRLLADWKEHWIVKKKRNQGRAVIGEGRVGDTKELIHESAEANSIRAS